MRRGDVVTVALAGDYGKPRPAVVVQSDRLSAEKLDSVLICQITSFVRDAEPRRITVQPTDENGLRELSQIMVEKISAARREKLGKHIGRMDHDTMARLDAALEFVLGLLD